MNGVARVLLATVVAFAAGSPARADDDHAVTAECGYASNSLATALWGWAHASGHARPVSTTVRCWAIDVYGQQIAAAEQSVPGPVAVAAGAGHTTSPFAFARTVCVTASAYWSDGHTAGLSSVCVGGSASTKLLSVKMTTGDNR